VKTPKGGLGERPGDSFGGCRYTRRGGRTLGFEGLGRLLHALAVSAAIGAQLAASPAWAAQPRAAIAGEMDPDLRAAIVRAVGETDRPIDNRFEARRRASAAAEDAIAVLRSEGYYAYDVAPELGEGDTPAPSVRIAPGPRFRLARPTLEWIGGRPDPVTELAAQAALALDAGGPGRAADVVSAEGRAVAAVQDRGYADVAPQPRQVVVDHADQTVQPTYRLATGPLVKLDGIRLSTNGRTGAAWLRGSPRGGVATSTSPTMWPASSDGCWTPASTTP